MKTKILHTAKILLLLLAILPSLTTFIFQFQEKAIQHKMKKQLDKQSLLTISIHEADFRWAKKGKELWLNNHLFDVKSYSYSNGVYLFTGLFDDDETLLVKQLRHNQEEGNTKNNKVLVQLFELFETTHNTETEESISSTIINRVYADYSTALSMKHSTIIIPPPQA